MANEIKILVRTQNSARAGLEAVDKDVQAFAKTSSEKFAKTFSENTAKNFTETLTTRLRTIGDQARGSAQTAGDSIGDTIGRRISEKISQRVKVSIDENGRALAGAASGGGTDNRTTVRDRERVTVDVDVDKQSLLSKLGALGKSAGQKFGDFFGDGFKTTMSGILSGDFISTLIKGALIGAGGAAIAAPVAAAVSSGILVGLGGGAIGAGIASAIKNSPTLNSSIDGLKQKIGSVFNDFGGSFKGPLADFFQMASGVLDDLKPMIDDIGATLAPVADNLGHGVIGLLQNALPGIGRAMKDSAPLIDTLADELPGIGDAIGKFFDHIRKSAPAANTFFNDLLNIIPYVIRILGVLIETFTQVYSIFRYTFFAMLTIAATWAEGIATAASIAFGWVPGLGPKLNTAAHKAAEFKEKVNKQLSGIHDVDISVRIKTVGLNTAVAVLDITRQLRAIGAIRKAAGGAIGHAAEGGPRNGLTWVGEQGPELIQAAPGSRVMTAGDSQRMAGGGGDRVIVMRPVLDKGAGAERSLIDALFRSVRWEVSTLYGGDVQAALGS